MNYALIFDEVNIRKQIVFQGNGFTGFVDYGGIAEEPETKVEAKTALFILASLINGHKKVPIVYILTAGLNAKLMSTVVQQSIKAIEAVHGKVLTITFDGLASNFTATELLGAKISYLDIALDSIEPYIRHPTTGSKIFVFPDPSHMFKLLRNALKAFKFLVDVDGKVL